MSHYLPRSRCSACPLGPRVHALADVEAPFAPALHLSRRFVPAAHLVDHAAMRALLSNSLSANDANVSRDTSTVMKGMQLRLLT